MIGGEERIVELDHRVVDEHRIDEAEQLSIGPVERCDLQAVAVLAERQPRLARLRVVLDDDVGEADDRAIRVAPGGVMCAA